MTNKLWELFRPNHRQLPMVQLAVLMAERCPSTLTWYIANALQSQKGSAVKDRLPWLAVLYCVFIP